MNNWDTTPRFDKEWNSFTSIEISELRKLKRKILKFPVPPETTDWKILHQFEEDYPEGIVCAHRINHDDRLVYELNSETGFITFTNCRGHNYRNKSYSDLEFPIRKLFSDLKPKCKTKGQKLAFNKILNSFKFNTSK